MVAGCSTAHSLFSRCTLHWAFGSKEPRRQRGSTVASAFQDLVKGKTFHCTECGKCCTGQGEVWINSADLDRLSLRLNIQKQHVLARYTKSYSRRPGWWLLRNTPGTQDCIFLEGTQCTVNAAKPLQCSTYPWWPELMEHWAWEGERESTCEGLDHPEAGALDSHHAAAQLRAATEHFAARDAAALAPKERR